MFVSTPKKARGDLWGLSCPRKLALAIFIHPEQFGTFPERLALPKPDEEILSGYEEGVRDGFLAWVKADPETILRRHVVDARGLYPAFREEPARRYGPSSQQCQLNDEVPNRLTEQRRLSVYNWTMRNLSWEGGEEGGRREGVHVESTFYIETTQRKTHVQTEWKWDRLAEDMMLDVSCETREANTGMRCEKCVWHSVRRTPRVRAEERHRMRTSMQSPQTKEITKFLRSGSFGKKGLQQRLQRKATLDSKGTSGSRESVSTWHTTHAFFNALPDHA